MTSVMPKGVEHGTPSSKAASGKPVMTSVMPKGVEHFPRHAFLLSFSPVMTSVMPKGVEHSAGGNFLPQPLRDDLSDAERR